MVTTNTRKCSGTKGYACGKSCISVKFICRKEMSGQSVDIADKLTAAIATVSSTNKRAVTESAPRTNMASSTEIHPVIKTFAQQEEAHSINGLRDAPDAILKSLGYSGGDSKIIQEALRGYSGGNSVSLKKAEAGLPGYTNYSRTKNINAINDYLDKAPKFKGEITSGFVDDMVDVFGINDLKANDEFSFPSMTSFTSEQNISKSFNGAGVFKIINNKSGASIRAFSTFSEEQEVLVPKKAKYKVVSKSVLDESTGKVEIVLEEI